MFGFLQNQREIAENYPNFLKTQKALLPVEMSNFNQKKKIVTNSALAKIGQETFFRSEGNFQDLD